MQTDIIPSAESVETRHLGITKYETPESVAIPLIGTYSPIEDTCAHEAVPPTDSINRPITPRSEWERRRKESAQRMEGLWATLQSAEETSTAEVSTLTKPSEAASGPAEAVCSNEPDVPAADQGELPLDTITPESQDKLEVATSTFPHSSPCNVSAMDLNADNPDYPSQDEIDQFNEQIPISILVAWLNEVYNTNPIKTISSFHNIVISDDNRSWIDNGTLSEGLAFDFARECYGPGNTAFVKTWLNEVCLDSEFMELRNNPVIRYDLSEHPFPINRLPTCLRRMAEAIAEMEGVPDAMAGCAVIGAASASLGKGVKMDSKQDKCVYGNLFIMVDGPSGSGKTGTCERAGAPIYRFEHKLMELDQQNRLLAKAQLRNEVGKHEPAHKDDPPKPASGIQKLPDCILVGDITTEQLAVVLAQNGRVSSYAGEARGIVQVLSGRYANWNANDSLYVQAFSVERFKQARISREPIIIEKPCLSIMWMMQPCAFNTIWSCNSFITGGFLPRFLPCRTMAMPTELTAERKVFHTDVLEDYEGTITSLLETYWSNEGPTIRVQVSLPARELIIDYHNRVVKRIRAREFADQAVPFATRWAEMAWKLTLVFHAAIHGSKAHLEQVVSATAMDAVAVVSWFALQQLELLDEREVAEYNALEQKIMHLTNGGARITASSVHKASITKTSDAAKKILSRMEGHGLLESQVTTGSGRRTTVYFRPSNYDPNRRR